VQWHQLARTGGSLSSKRIPPQRQPPVSIRVVAIGTWV